MKMMIISYYQVLYYKYLNIVIEYNKYKKLGGATTAIPQPNKPPSNSPSISASVSNTYNSFKEFYTKIILFVKTNFIFSLLTSVLLLVYVGLYFTDPVTEEDIKKSKETAKVKCDKFTGTCPNGQKIINDKDCVDNICTSDICCSFEFKCDAFRCQCPTVKLMITTKTCPLDKGCDGNYCCVKSCQGFPQTQCGSSLILNPSNTGEQIHVVLMHRSEPRKTCGSTDGTNTPYICPSGYTAK